MDMHVRKNRSSYCHGSKLSDSVFEIILLCFLSGKSVTKAEQRISEQLKIKPPTLKSIGRHYDDIGLALFDRTYGKEWHAQYPHLDYLRDTDEQEYELALDSLSDPLHFEALYPLDPEYARPVKPGEKPWGESLEAKEYREFSALRNGIRYRSRGHLGLVRFRAKYHSTVSVRRGVKTLAFTENDLNRLYEDIKEMFLNERC